MNEQLAGSSAELTQIRRSVASAATREGLGKQIENHISQAKFSEATWGVKIVSLIDTDSNPDDVDLPIPGNDDSIRSIRLILSHIADSINEGKAAVPQKEAAPVEEEPKAVPSI